MENAELEFAEIYPYTIENFNGGYKINASANPYGSEISLNQTSYCLPNLGLRKTTGERVALSEYFKTETIQFLILVMQDSHSRAGRFAKALQDSSKQFRVILCSQFEDYQAEIYDLQRVLHTQCGVLEGELIILRRNLDICAILPSTDLAGVYRVLANS